MPKVIANPPMGIYRGDINICHAYFLVLLDVYGRYIKLFSKKDVICPFYSYNFFGKRGDKLVPEGTPEDELFKTLDEHAEKYIIESINRSYLNLSSSERLVDNEPKLVQAVQNDFKKLAETGFLILNGKEALLDCPKIKGRFNLKKLLANIKPYPERVQVELERLIDENTDEPTKITRDTRYAPKNPIGGENISPLFCLANLWDYKYPDSEFTITGSYSVLAKYTFLRFLCRTALEGHPGIHEIFTWSKINPEGGINNWDIKQLCSDLYKTDILRYSFVSAHSLSKQKVSLEKDRLDGGRKFVYLIGNLRKVLSPSEPANEKPKYSEYYESMRNFKFNKALDWLREQFKTLSMEIKERKENGTFEENKKRLSQVYVSLTKLAEPIVPAIAQKGRQNVSS